MISPLVIFMLTVLVILGGFFTLSYLVWSDRAKTPEVVAAELSMFSEQFSNAIAILGLCTITSIVIFAFSNLFSQVN